MILKISLLGLLLLVDYALGSCSECQSNFVACHSETSFSLCQDGFPTDDIVMCPAGRVCTDQTTICVPREDDSVKATCVQGCGICASYEKVFSCLSETTYAFCFGETEPFNSSGGSCADGYVCDLSSRTVCVPEGTSQPSCVATTSTTTPITRDAGTFCSETAMDGTFKAEGDTTCKRYYICVSSRGGFRGFEYTCNGYFNSELKYCQKEMPENC